MTIAFILTLKSSRQIKPKQMGPGTISDANPRRTICFPYTGEGDIVIIPRDKHSS
jgi:hypothetical protein